MFLLLTNIPLDVWLTVKQRAQWKLSLLKDVFSILNTQNELKLLYHWLGHFTWSQLTFLQTLWRNPRFLIYMNKLNQLSYYMWILWTNLIYFLLNVNNLNKLKQLSYWRWKLWTNSNNFHTECEHFEQTQTTFILNVNTLNKRKQLSY